LNSIVEQYNVIANFGMFYDPSVIAYCSQSNARLHSRREGTVDSTFLYYYPVPVTTGRWLLFYRAPCCGSVRPSVHPSK